MVHSTIILSIPYSSASNPPQHVLITLNFFLLPLSSHQTLSLSLFLIPCFSFSHNLRIHLFFSVQPPPFSSHKSYALFISLTPSLSLHPSCCRLPDSGDSGGQTGSGHLHSPPPIPSQSLFDLLCEFLCLHLCV